MPEFVHIKAAQATAPSIAAAVCHRRLEAPRKWQHAVEQQPRSLTWTRGLTGLPAADWAFQPVSQIANWRVASLRGDGEEAGGEAPEGVAPHNVTPLEESDEDVFGLGGGLDEREAEDATGWPVARTPTGTTSSGLRPSPNPEKA